MCIPICIYAFIAHIYIYEYIQSTVGYTPEIQSQVRLVKKLCMRIDATTLSASWLDFASPLFWLVGGLEQLYIYIGNNNTN